MEAVEGLEVKEFKEKISVWTRNRILFFWALAQLGDSALPIKANFRLNRSRPKLQGRNDTVASSSQKSPRAFLTEEQIFSLDWKVEKLYRDPSEERTLCRHLTAFIKRVRCAEMNVTDRGLMVSFNSLRDLEEALAKFCTSASDTLAKLKKRRRAFTLLPSHGKATGSLQYSDKSCFRVVRIVQRGEGEPSPLLKVPQVPAQDLLCLVPNQVLPGQGSERSFHPANISCSLDRLPQHIHPSQDGREGSGRNETTGSTVVLGVEFQHHLPPVGSITGPVSPHCRAPWTSTSARAHPKQQTCQDWISKVALAQRYFLNRPQEAGDESASPKVDAAARRHSRAGRGNDQLDGAVQGRHDHWSNTEGAEGTYIFWGYG